MREKKGDIFSPFGGTPMHFSPTKCCFWKGGKFKRDFEKMKWQVKMREKMPFDWRKKEVTFFSRF